MPIILLLGGYNSREFREGFQLNQQINQKSQMENCVTKTKPNLTSSHSVIRGGKKTEPRDARDIRGFFRTYQRTWGHDREVYLFFISHCCPDVFWSLPPLPQPSHYYRSASSLSLPLSRAHSPDQKNILSQLLSWALMMMRQEQKVAKRTQTHTDPKQSFVLKISNIK